MKLSPGSDLSGSLGPGLGVSVHQHPPRPTTVVPTILGVSEDSADEEVTVTVNNPISLICEALAFPSPTITWMKDGAPFEASNNIQLLPGDALCGGRSQGSGDVSSGWVRGRDW